MSEVKSILLDDLNAARADACALAERLRELAEAFGYTGNMGAERKLLFAAQEADLISEKIERGTITVFKAFTGKS